MTGAGTGLLWTPLPLELILEGLEGVGAQVPQCVDLIQGGRILQVQPLGSGLGIIQRLISSDPQDYLAPQWQPGTRIPLA